MDHGAQRQALQILRMGESDPCATDIFLQPFPLATTASFGPKNTIDTHIPISYHPVMEALSGINPVIQRELTLASRQPETYRIRTWSLGIALMVFSFILILSENAISNARLGRMLFETLVYLTFPFVLFIGVFTSSDCLSHERREGTLPLLFLARLRPFQVILGKYVAMALSPVYILVAMLPVFSLTILIGGVRIEDLLQISLALLTMQLFSLAVGILVSALTEDAREAMKRTAGTLLLLTVILPLIEPLPGAAYDAFSIRAVLVMFSPYVLLERSLDTLQLIPYFPTLVTQACLVPVCLILATVATMRNLGERAQEPQKNPNPAMAKASPKDAMASHDFRSKLAGSTAPLPWFVRRALDYKKRSLFPRIAAVILISLFGLHLLRTHPSDVTQTMLILIPLHIAFKAYLTANACRLFHEFNHRGTLELLTITPQRINGLAPAAVTALVHQHRWHLRILALLNLACLARTSVGLSTRGSITGEVLFLFGLVVLGGIALLYQDSRTLIWVGLASGLRHRKLGRSILFAFRKVMLFSWAVFLILITTMALFGVGGWPLMIAIGCWQGISYLQAKHLANVNQISLGHQFRAQNFEPVR